MFLYVLVVDIKEILKLFNNTHVLKSEYFNLSAVAEHHQKTGHKPDLENTKVLCREDKLIPRKVREAIFIRKETSPTLNRDRGRELSKIYDSLLETPRSRTPSTASSRSESVSQHSATIRWGRRRVSLKYSDFKTWVLLNSFKISLKLYILVIKLVKYWRFLLSRLYV